MADSVHNLGNDFMKGCHCEESRSDDEAIPLSNCRT